MAMKRTDKPDKPRAESYALVIGIEDYKDINLGQANFAERDAKEFHKILTETPIGKLSIENVELLLSKDAAVTNLGRAIRRLFQRVTPLDTVFLYFSGHGKSADTGGYLLPRSFEDTEDVDMDTEAYSFSSLNRHLRARRPRNFIFLFDCCFSGKALEQIDLNYDLYYRGSKSHQVGSRKDYIKQCENDREEEQQCRMVFCSCLADEEAAGISNFGHGIFTNFLVEGLKGEADHNCDGRVDVDELVIYVKAKMSAYNKEHNIYQNPGLYQRVSGRFFLPSWGKIHPSGAVEVYDCPICGRRNEKRETFHCKGCGRDYLCLIHQVKGSWVCEECEQEKKKRELAIELDIITPSKAKKQSTYLDPYTGIEFVHVKGGEYEMGDMFGDGTEDEKPVHKVIVNDFCIGKYLVNQGQWIRVMNEFVPIPLRENYPVEAVSWKHVQQFIDRLNQRTDKNYRLPTEAEWEYAARSGGKREKWAGTSDESELGEYAWYHANSGDTSHSVGQRQPNSIGLYDMSGNVWEWCGDWYADDYYKRSPSNNPKGPELGKERVLRGGAEGSTAKYVRVSCRNSHEPSLFPARPIGFRLVLPPR